MQHMSEEEKQKPDLLVKSAKRKRQLARDSGRSQADVNDLLTTFTQMRVKMKTMSKMMAQSGGMGAYCSLFCHAHVIGFSHAGHHSSLSMGRDWLAQARIENAECCCNVIAVPLGAMCNGGVCVSG